MGEQEIAYHMVPIMVHIFVLFCSWALYLESGVLAAKKGGTSPTIPERVCAYVVNSSLRSNKVSQELYDRLYLYSRFSAGAYDSKCSRAPNGAAVMKYLNVASTHTQGVLFNDEKRKEIVLAFRGTNSIQDFQYDGMWNLVPMKLSNCPNCQVNKISIAQSGPKFPKLLLHVGS